MGKYVVKYVENGVKKESAEFADRDEAFAFQAGLVTKRQKNAAGEWDIELDGVYDLAPMGR